MQHKFCFVFVLLFTGLSAPLFSQYNKTYENNLGVTTSYPLGVGLNYEKHNSSSPMAICMQARFWLQENQEESKMHLVLSGGFDYYFLQTDGFFLGLDFGHTFYKNEKITSDSLITNLEYFAFFLNPNLGYTYTINRLFVKTELGYELEMAYKISGSEKLESKVIAIEYNSRDFKAKHHPSKPYASITLGFKL